MLNIRNLSVSIEKKQILKDISLDFKPGKTYAIMGPNGSGKSTLASAIMGHPDITYARASKLLIGNKNIKNLSPDKRAALGLALSFQTPLALPGVTVSDLLRIATEKRLDPVALHHMIRAYAKELHISDELLKRSINDGFSGGERKKLEALQIAILEPTFIMFDEIDTGVDVDALRTITTFLKKRLPKTTTKVFITHSAKLLKYVRPDVVVVLKQGRLVKTGKAALAKRIEKDGFDKIES
jgi:Fe-S cluster assembly ATP-binding protein